MESNNLYEKELNCIENNDIITETKANLCIDYN